MKFVFPILLQVAPAPAPAMQPAEPPPQTQQAEAPPATSGRILRLDDAVAIALKNQPTIVNAKAQTAAAQGRVTEAKQLYYPQAQAQASYQRVRSASKGGVVSTTSGTGAGAGTGTGTGTGTGGTGTTASTPTAFGGTDASGTNVWTVGASASQLIWDFGATRNKVHAAEKLVDSFAANEHAALRSIIVDVRRSYFTARAQKALVVVAKQSLDNFQKHLEQIEGFVKVGTRPEIDVVQARTDVANARLSLIQADNAYAIAKAQITRAIGADGPSDFDVSDEELGPVPGEDGNSDQLMGAAVKTRPDIQVYQRQRESYDLSVRSFKAQYWPTLSATGGFSETGSSLGDLGPAWNVGAIIAWPFFQGWLTHGQIAEAEANAAAASASAEGVKVQIRVDIEQAQLNIKAAKASQLAATEAESNAKERLRLAEGRYTAGVGSIIELGDAQVALAQASANVVTANFNLSSARADLLAALGER